MKQEITLKDVQKYCHKHFRLFMKNYAYGKETFQMNNRFLSFSYFADFLIKEGFIKNDLKLIQQIADYINLLLAEGADSVRNPVYVSFIETLVDRGYKYSHLKGFVWQMPEEVRTFIKGYFIVEVIDSLELNVDETK